VTAISVRLVFNLPIDRRLVAAASSLRANGKFLSLKGLAWSDGNLSPPKANDYHATSHPRDPPAERIRACRRERLTVVVPMLPLTEPRHCLRRQMPVGSRPG
jgi:hypothetical protein